MHNIEHCCLLYFILIMYAPQDGIYPVEYKALRNTPKIEQILADARNLDAQGRVRKI